MVAVETVLAVALAATVGLVPMVLWSRWGAYHALAAGVIAFPVMESLVGFVQVAPLIGRPTTLRPYTTEQLAELPWRIAEDTLAVPAVGLALVALVGGATVVRQHVEALWPGGRGARQQLALGWTIVPLIVLAEAVALALLAGPASFLQTGDESALFANATWQHVLLLSLVPGLVEEIYYRGLLQGLIERLVPEAWEVWGAIGIQAVLFGLAHGGYATLSHLLGPLVFGLGMGYLRATVGLGACIVGHVGVNLFYFSVDPGAGSLELQLAVAAVVIVGLVGLYLAWRTLIARVRAGPRASYR